MKLIQSLLLLCIPFSVYGQSYQFFPDWKVGQVKTVIIVEEKYSVESGHEVFIRRDTSVGPTIEVVQEFDDFYLLEVNREPQILDLMGKTLKGYDEMIKVENPLRLKVSKKS